MSQKKQRPPAKAPAKVPAAASIQAARDYSLWITAAYFVVALIGVLNHEMWRDEFQAWLVARDSHSLHELVVNNKYEGHPLLWYIVLYGLTAITVNPVALQFLNLAFGVGAVYLFCRYSNFSTVQKILFACGYYVMFEYVMISRYHTLALLLAFAFCALYRNRRKYIYWMFLMLFLLANASLINNVLAIALTGILVFDYIVNRKKEEWKGVSAVGFFAGTVIVIAGMVWSAVVVMPEEDNLFNPSLSSLAEPAWLAALFSRIDNAYMAFRELISLPHWTAIGQLDIRKENVGIHVFISLVLVAATCISLMRRPLALLYYLAATFGLLLIYGITYLTAVRYMGHLFIAWLTALWLYAYYREHTFRGFAESLAKKGLLIRAVLIFVVLAAQVPVALAYYVTDAERPFSTSREASDYLREQKLDNLPILGTIDFAVSPFSGWLNKPIFYPEIKKPGTFLVWDSHRKVPHDFGQVVPMIDSLMKQQKKMLVITSYKISFSQGGQMIDLEHDFLTDSLKIDLLKRFERSMVPDESYSLYLVERIK